MNQNCKLSIVTKAYLERFYEILEEMIEGMTCVCPADSISDHFILQMIPHHRAAIEMSENLLQYTTCIPLQDIALQIIDEQTESIRQMQEIQCSCKEWVNLPREIDEYQTRVDQIMGEMFSRMENACATNHLNGDFIREMIPHHRGAIQMSRNALRYKLCPGLIPILEAIITSQTKGILQMESLLRTIRG